MEINSDNEQSEKLVSTRVDQNKATHCPLPGEADHETSGTVFFQNVRLKCSEAVFTQTLHSNCW